MDKFSALNNSNPAYIETLYQEFKNNPDTIDTSWQNFFSGYDFAETHSQSGTTSSTQISSKEIAVIKLIQGYRSRGHLIANTNPIRKRRIHKSDLELSYFGLTEDDLNQSFESGKEIGIGTDTLANILNHLKLTYCSTIGTEFMYCRNENLRQWIYKELEHNAHKNKFKSEEKLNILHLLSQAVGFENFLQTKYIGKKRFSLEGLEVVIPALNMAIREAAKTGAKEFVLGMAHRGRLNVLANVFQKSYDDVFSEFEENIYHDFIKTGGDVKYHLGKSADITTPEGYPIHLSLVPNPSHLEAVSPVVSGITNAKKIIRYNNNPKEIIPIVLHGDAAISGQGINYEVANMSKLEGYDNGGTIHIVTNNQVGFTANYKESRSSVYCTDLAKVTESPVFHVNADDPEAVIYAIKTAIKLRQEFHQDVYIDILGYRKYGHNEGDEPRFTQPILYNSISKHENVYQLYLNKLNQENVITNKEAEEFNNTFKKTLQEKLDSSKKKETKQEPDMFKSTWKGYRLATAKDFEESIETKVGKKELDTIATTLNTVPESFNIFSKTKKIMSNRHNLYSKEKKVDWAMAELLAYGTLLKEGHSVRVSGQDSQRGTFSHRHAVLKDTETEEHYIPLNNIEGQEKQLYIYNSLLSEYGVLAFEYGYSLANPNALVIWEAQFGDFANGAQIVIDQFISASEIKWQKVSGLVMLLPHGYEGQGPEHSSARLERFLQLCAEENMYVCNITTPANFFHVLRRQVKQNFRKPLIIMSPKSLLRHPSVISTVDELTKEKFKEIIDDTTTTPKDIKKVLLCSGKLYYDLMAKKDASHNSIAIIRLEQLYPLSKTQLTSIKKKYTNATEWVWVQEEPENMGAWTHMLRHLRDWNLSVIARPEGASPATGSSKIHATYQDKIIKRALTVSKNKKGAS